MNKKDLFIKAMKAKCYERLAWSFNAFCITREDAEEYKKDPYPYRIVQTPVGAFYCDPEQNNALVKIDDFVAGEPLFKFKDRLDITPEDIPNLSENINTSYGNLIVNYITLINSFGKKVPYQEGKFSIEKVEKFLIDVIEEVPVDGSPKKENVIYIDEYVKFCNSVFFLTGFAQICVWSITEKLLLPPPGIKEFKAKLINENKDSLSKASTVAKIDAQLVEYDKEWLKGDPGENFLNNKKAKISRKKLFLMHGGEIGLDSNSVDVTLVENSLSEGWDVNAFPAMNNSLRIGSFNRGQETALGGVSVKWLLRASSNLNVTEDDCGSRVGKTITITESNKSDIVGFSVIMKEGSKPVVTDDDASSYLGKKIMVRSPMYCKLTLTDFCKVCVGKRLALNPDGLSSAVSKYGTAFLSMYLAAAHAKELSLAKMDYKISIT